jgi:hypothetical protein
MMKDEMSSMKEINMKEINMMEMSSMKEMNMMEPMEYEEERRTDGKL